MCRKNLGVLLGGLLSLSVSQAGAQDAPILLAAAGNESVLNQILPDENHTFHAQSTLIPQWHGSFNSPYAGPMSLHTNPDLAASLTATVFAGTKLPWKGGEFYINPEASGGSGINGGFGLAGYTNGEVERVGSARVSTYIARAFLRQQWGLSGDMEKVEDDLNQIVGERDKSRVVLTLGKMSVLDLFDTNTYAGDARSQFMNWSLQCNPAWDFPADTRGYTWGGALEYIHPRWAVRAGIWQMPEVANGINFDDELNNAHGEAVEFEEDHFLNARPGKIKFLTYVNQARMGTYDQSLALQPVDPNILATRAPGNVKYGFGLNAEQELTDDIGVFARLGWNDGKTETFVYTEVDRTASVGASIKGARWHRPDDHIGLAGVVNGLSDDHKNYLAAGGDGFMIGDGQLNYGTEDIFEGYYLCRVFRWLGVTFDYQRVINPAYNRDRGPVDVYAVRIHWQV
jgi:high affinity Mn2+ porin